MITDGILNVVFNVLDMFFGVLPDMSLEFSGGMYRTFLDIVASVAYLFPLNTLISIFAVVCSFIAFKWIVTLIRLIWDLLPIA